jgi:hypothetical protein
MPIDSDRSETAPLVVVLKKTQGSVWSEFGRTPLCPTPQWLNDTYGAGEYELRLKLGNRVVCMTNVRITPPSTQPPSTQPPATRSWPASGSARDRGGIAPRGTALG